MAVSITAGILSLLLIFLGGVVIIGRFLYTSRGKPLDPSYHLRMENYTSRRDELHASAVKQARRAKKPKQPKKQRKPKKRDIESRNFIEIDGFGKIRGCCNQTARLNEQYCVCGRSVPEKLREYYNNSM